MTLQSFSLFFFFNDPAPTEIYTLSLPDALPISHHHVAGIDRHAAAADRHLALDRVMAHEIERRRARAAVRRPRQFLDRRRSEEHTSELQSLAYLVCRLLLEKKKNIGCDVSHILC